MSVLDIFRLKKIKAENETLKADVTRYESLLTPELHELAAQKKAIAEASQELFSLTTQKYQTEKALRECEESLSEKRKQLLSMDDDLLVQEFSLYRPTYQFTKSEEYKKRLDKIRQDQKEMIKGGYAVSGSDEWTVNGSKAEGRRMVKNMQKLLLRAFNSECDELIDKVKYSNYDLSVRRLNSAYESIEKLGERMNVAIMHCYYLSKLDELNLAFEYQQIQQQEKEERKEARAQAREAEKLAKEIAEQRKKIEKEEAHYLKALANIVKQLDNASLEEKADLLSKKIEISEHLEKIEKALKDIDYREANIKAGYVYIISNIGAFGEGIYKIGMTRRLDPLDRIDELSDASVPFNFDVHAMIFSDDAPGLESALHRAFEDRKVNMVNHRREFFRVSLDEIKEVVRKNYDKTVEFVDVPDAEQYRITEKMRHSV